MRSFTDVSRLDKAINDLGSVGYYIGLLASKSNDVL